MELLSSGLDYALLAIISLLLIGIVANAVYTIVADMGFFLKSRAVLIIVLVTLIASTLYHFEMPFTFSTFNPLSYFSFDLNQLKF